MHKYMSFSIDCYSYSCSSCNVATCFVNSLRLVALNCSLENESSAGTTTSYCLLLFNEIQRHIAFCYCVDNTCKDVVFLGMVQVHYLDKSSISSGGLSTHLAGKSSSSVATTHILQCVHSAATSLVS